MDEFSIENLAENILTRWLKTRVETVYGISIEPEVFPPDNSEFGDSTTNLPFNLAGVVKKSPVEIGREIIAENIPEIFSDAQVVGGYINFWLSDEYIHHMIRNIITHPECWGKIINHNPKKIQVEFVSANPTGPLNIVSARAATVGSTLANVLSAIGNNVQTEFYVNDAGNQIKLLTESFNIRIAQIKGENVQLPENAYHGEYLIEYAREYMENDEPIPAMDWILERILAEQKETLHRFRTDFDVWFSEREFRKSGKIEQVLNRLEQKSLIYHNEGAKWFSASKIDPDVEDFVLVKSDGEWAYGLVDIAYHINKFEERQFDIVYTILGPDHHGHKARLETAMNALGHKNKLKIIILQQVNLIENGERVMMSKRAGKLITMDVLVDDVGVDAARYFFLARKAEAHLDFDINLARDTSEENPVYYIQYAYARINGILDFAKQKGMDVDKIRNANLNILTEPEERKLIRKIVRFPSEIMNTAYLMQPHIIPFYLFDIAKIFHNFYTKHRVVCDDERLALARCALISAVAKTIERGLNICGIEAPEQM